MIALPGLNLIEPDIPGDLRLGTVGEKGSNCLCRSGLDFVSPSDFSIISSISRSNLVLLGIGDICLNAMKPRCYTRKTSASIIAQCNPLLYVLHKKMPDIEYGNFVKISLFKLGQGFRLLDADEREQGKQEFAAAIDELSSIHQILSYSTVGTRADADLMLVQDSPSVETFHATASRINTTLMGRYLEQPYSYLSIRRKSRYKHGGGAADPKDDYKYLIIYPMTKTRPWYERSMEDRQKMMNDHFRVGKKYPMVKINTTYAFGLDDTEFVLGFEMDDPSDFVSLVMDLREVPVAQYTATEIPIFTTIRMPIAEALDAMT